MIVSEIEQSIVFYLEKKQFKAYLHSSLRDGMGWDEMAQDGMVWYGTVRYGRKIRWQMWCGAEGELLQSAIDSGEDRIRYISCHSRARVEEAPGKV